MRIISLVFIAVSAFVVAAPLKLAEGGRALYRIECASGEEFAAEELKWALDEITGSDFKISEDGDGPAIFVGKTDYAKSLVNFLSRLELPAKMIVRKESHVVYM